MNWTLEDNEHWYILYSIYGPNIIKMSMELLLRSLQGPESDTKHLDLLNDILICQAYVETIVAISLRCKTPNPAWNSWKAMIIEDKSLS